ncbi:MAG: class I SAM-dependent methyltransferase, partial [Thermodesulfobacteriota bacterium]
METSEYKTMYEVEDSYWWYVGLRDLVFSYFKKQYPHGSGLKILDAGCGTGALLENLIEHGYRDVKGMDISEHALFYCKKRDLNQILLGSISKLPFRNNQFDLITSMDVLCCLQVVDDLSALREFYRVLKSYGRLILHVPAYKFLMSEHDKATHTGIRYSKDDLYRKLELAGFKIERITYRNSFLFPLVMFY